MKRIIVTACAGAAAAVAATLPLGAQQSQPAAAADPATPSLANIMATIQFRHLKLAYSGRVTNWPLAGYELDLIQQSFDTAARLYPVFKGVPVAELIKQESAPPIAGPPAGDRCQEQRRFCQSLRQADRGMQWLPSGRRRGLYRHSDSGRVAFQQSSVRADRGEIMSSSRKLKQANRGHAPLVGALRIGRSLEHFPVKWTSGFPQKMRPRQGI